MRAIILAAGRGSRMGPLTQDRPKCLTTLAGRALLDWQIDALRNAGLGPIGIVTGYLGEMLGARADRHFHNPRWADTNMVTTLGCAAEWLATGPVLVAYADIFYPTQTVARLAAAAHTDIAISYDPDWLSLWQERFADPLSDAESFRIDTEGNLLDIGQRVANASEIEGQYMGLLRISPTGWRHIQALLDTLPADEADRLDMTGLLQKLLGTGLRIHTVPHTGPWGEIDNCADLAFYEAQVKAKLLNLHALTGNR